MSGGRNTVNLYLHTLEEEEEGGVVASVCVVRSPVDMHSSPLEKEEVGWVGFLHVLFSPRLREEVGSDGDPMSQG